MFCRESQRNVPKIVAHVQSHLFSNEPFCFWMCFSSVIARVSFNMIQIARHCRSSLDSHCIFDSGHSLQVEFILLNDPHTTFWHCRKRSYASFGQPFPKNLYTLFVHRASLELQSFFVPIFFKIWASKLGVRLIYRYGLCHGLLWYCTGAVLTLII